MPAKSASRKSFDRMGLPAGFYARREDGDFDEGVRVGSEKVERPDPRQGNNPLRLCELQAALLPAWSGEFEIRAFVGDVDARSVAHLQVDSRPRFEAREKDRGVSVRNVLQRHSLPAF